MNDGPHDQDDLDEAEPRLSKRDFVFMLVFVVILTLLVFIAATHGSGDTISPQ